MREVLRTQEVNKASQKARLDLANAEAEFQATLARNLILWAEQEEEHQKRVEERKVEINKLEVRKLNMLVPFGILKEGTDDRMKNAEKFLKELVDREENVEILTEKLENRLDEIGQKDQDLRQKERALALKEEGIKRQSESIILGNKRLSKEIADFAKIKDEAEKDIDRRKTDIFLMEQTLNARDKTLKRTDKELSNLAKRLEDERGTLGRAWEELRRKQS